MIIVYFIIFTLAMPFYMYAKKRENIASFIPYSLLGSIIVFLPFIFLGIHRVAAYVLFLLVLALYMLAIFEMRKNKQKLLGFFEPGIVLYILLLPILYFITKQSSPMLWDELRLWAAVPKYLYFSGVSHIGVDSFIYTDMQNYPPAMPAFQLLIMYMQGYWSDNILFFAYVALVASFFVGIVPKNKRSYFALPLLLAMCIFLPQSYANSYEFDSNFYYTSLFIDPFIGFIIAYLLVLLSKNPFESTLSSIGFAVGLGVLAMSKESGIFLSSLLIVFSAIMYLPYIIRNKKTSSIYIVAIPFVFFIAFLSILILSGVKEPPAFTIGELIETLQNLCEENSPIIKDFFKTPLEYYMVLQGNAVTWFNAPEIFNALTAFIFSIILSVCAVIISDKENRKRIAKLSVLAAIFVVIYYISLLPVYLFVIGYEEYQFASLQRYLSTAYIAHMFFSIYIITESILKSPKRYKVIICSIILVVIVLIFPLGEIKRMPYEYEQEQGKICAADISSQAEPNSKVFLIMNNSAGEDILIHHQTYYALFENNINIDNTMFEIDWISYPDEKALAEKLQKYDYCYLYADYEDIFKNNYQGLFQTEITFPRLYIVEKHEDSVILK